MRSICSSTSIVLGLNDRISHDCNCSLFVFPHGLYLCKNIVFSMARSLNFDLFVWNQTNAVLSNICSKRSMSSNRILEAMFYALWPSCLMLWLSGNPTSDTMIKLLCTKMMMNTVRNYIYYLLNIYTILYK